MARPDEAAAALLLLVRGLVDPLEEVIRQHGVDPHIYTPILHTGKGPAKIFGKARKDRGG
jgi:hypothetical protein